MSTYFLATGRIGFSHWQTTDFQLARQLWGNLAVTRFISADGMNDTIISARLQTEINSQKQNNIQYWPVFLTAKTRFIGCCGLRPYGDAPRQFELGCHLLPEFWGQGLAFEAATAVINYAFTTLGATALYAGHHPDNYASMKLLTKLGFTAAGHQFYPPTGLEHPLYLYEQK